MKQGSWKEKAAAVLYSLIFPAVFLGCQVLVSVIMSFNAGIKAAAEMMSLGSMDETAMMNRAMEYAMENVLVASAASGLVTVGVIALWLYIRKQPFFVTLRFRRIPVSHSLCALGTGFGMYGVTSLLLAVLPFPESMVAQYEETMGAQMTGGDPMMSVLALVLIAPLTEELVFRGMCAGALEKAFPPWAVILLQGCVFALCHLIPYQIVYVFPVAVVLGLVYYWSGSMLAPLLLHASYNFLGVLTGMLEQEVLDGPLVTGLVYAGPVLTAVCLVFLYRTRAVKEQAAE